MGVFRWFGRLFGIAGDKANSVLDHLEDPKAALDQVLKDMQGELSASGQALGQTQAHAKKSRLDYESFQNQADEFRRSAESYLERGDELKARAMLRRSKEANKTADHFLKAAQKLEIDAESLRESITAMQMKLEEARSKKHSLLAQKRVAENLAKLHKSSAYSEAGSAFAQFDLINEKIDEQSMEAQTLYSMSVDAGVGDVMLRESEVDLELGAMKKRLELRALEDKSVKKTLRDLEDDLD